MSTAAVRTTQANPYVGPRSFQHGEDLYGRDRERRELLDLLIAERVVLLYSPSGAGKTSLVQAALMPALVNEGFLVRHVMRVSREPSEALEAGSFNPYLLSALLCLEDTPGITPGSLRKLANTSFEEYLSNTLPELQRLAPRPAASGAANEVLIFDQFEEILSANSTDLEAKRQFFEQVGKALRDRGRWALFSMREDYVAALDPYLRAIPTRLRNTYRLDLLGVAAAKEAVQKPARNNGVDFTDDAATKLIDNLRCVKMQRPNGVVDEELGPYVEPVQLQVVCSSIWERRTDVRRIAESDVGDCGDLNTALAHFYAAKVEAVALNTGTAERTIREWIEHQLITEQGMRGQASLGGLKDTAIWALVDSHLVRSEMRRNAPWFELAHDRLLDPVRQNNEEWLKAHLSPLQHKAKLWNDQGQPEGLLLLGADLAEAKQWAAANESLLTSTELKFLQESETKQDRILQERRQAKRLRLFTGAAVALAIIACAAAGFAYFEMGRASYSNLSAIDSAMEAITNAGKARLSEYKADGETWLAYSSAQIAKEKTAEAERQKREAVKEKSIAEQKTKQVQHDLTRIALRDAEDALDVRGRPDQALAYVARALQIDPQSTVIRSWVADLLLRRTWWVPSLQVQHNTSVRSVVFSPDGRRFITASDDGTAQVWDTDSGKAVGPPLRHEARVNSAVFSPDGKRVLTASDDKTAQVWDADTGKPIGPPLRDSLEVISASFSHDGQRILTTGKHGARVWETDTGKPLVPSMTVGYNATLTSAQFSPDGQRVLMLRDSDESDQLLVWDARTGKLLFNWDINVISAAFSPDGRQFVTGSFMGTMQIWDFETWKSVGEPLESSVRVASVAFDPDGKRIAKSVGGAVEVWDIKSRSVITRTPQEAATVDSVAFSPNGRWLLTVSTDNTARIWDAGGGTIVGVLPFVSSAVFTPGGARIAAISGNTAQLWEPEDGGFEPVSLAEGPVMLVSSVAFDHDGRRVITAYEKAAQLWDSRTGARLGPPLRHKDFVTSAAFSPDGSRVVTASGDNTAQVWDSQTGTTIGQPLQHNKPVRSAVFSPDGHQVLTASDDNTAKMWDAATGQPIGLSFRHRLAVTSAVFSPDGGRIATASRDGTAQVWDVRSGKAVGSVLQHMGPVHSVVFSPDGRLVLTASDDYTAQVWEADTGKPVGPPLRHVKGVWSAVFSPEAGRVVTASEDGTAQVWETATGKTVGLLLGPPDTSNSRRLDSALFSPDGQRVVTASVYTAAQLWDAETGLRLGAPLGHWSGMTSGLAVFSPDGRRVLTTSTNYHAAQVWQVLLGSGSSEEAVLINELARVVGGYEVNEFGSYAAVSIDKRLASIAALRTKFGLQSNTKMTAWLVQRLSTPERKN